MNRLSTLSLLLALSFAGCSKDDRDAPPPTGGAVNFEITDAPYPYGLLQQVNLTIAEVAVIDSSGGTSIVDSQTRTYDLLQLQQGRTALLAAVILPPGEYREFRLKVTDGTVVLTDGRSFPLNVPSGDSSGLKIKLQQSPLLVSLGSSSRLIFDFDLSRSLVPTPASATRAEDIRSFQLKPVIRAAVAADTGEIAGTTSLLSGGPVVGGTVTVEGVDFVQTTSTDANGNFVLSFLPPGIYTVKVESGNLIGVQLNVVVVTGNRTTINPQL